MYAPLYMYGRSREDLRFRSGLREAAPPKRAKWKSRTTPESRPILVTCARNALTTGNTATNGTTVEQKIYDLGTEWSNTDLSDDDCGRQARS
ncbi:hypothetical protein GCM10027271_13120 [Saccharopolyspora gloriosae]